MIVGDDVSVARDDDTRTGANGHRIARLRLLLTLATLTEEEIEERIVHASERLRLTHLLVGDAHHGIHRLLGSTREIVIGHRTRRGGKESCWGK